MVEGTRIARFPDFLYLGAAKCGSTWIFEALKAHPEVYVPPAKDLYYFTRFHDRGPGWYLDQFRSAGPEHRAVGELSINYLHNRKALALIHEELPDVRLIVSLRNPIERAWSGYTFLRRNDSFQGSFADAIEAGLPLVTEGSHYARDVKWLAENLGNHPLLVLFFDDLEADPVAFGQSVYRFLGVDDTFTMDDPESNPLPASTARSALLSRAVRWAARRMRKLGLVNLLGHIKASPVVLRMLYKPIAPAQKQVMKRADWERLRDMFAPEIEDLQKLTGRDLGNWLKAPDNLAA